MRNKNSEDEIWDFIILALLPKDHVAPVDALIVFG